MQDGVAQTFPTGLSGVTYNVRSDLAAENSVHGDHLGGFKEEFGWWTVRRGGNGWKSWCEGQEMLGHGALLGRVEGLGEGVASAAGEVGAPATMAATSGCCGNDVGGPRNAGSGAREIRRFLFLTVRRFPVHCI